MKRVEYLSGERENLVELYKSLRGLLNRLDSITLDDASRECSFEIDRARRAMGEVKYLQNAQPVLVEGILK